MCQVNTPGKRLLGGLLNLRVDGQNHVVARLGLDVPDVALGLPGRVNFHLKAAVDALQIFIELELDAVLTDLVTSLVTLVMRFGELLLVDLAHVPEHVCGLGAARVITQRELLDVDTGEVEGDALDQEALHLRGDVLLDHDRAVGILLVQIELLLDLFHGDADDLTQLGELPFGVLECRREHRHREAGAVLHQRHLVTIVDDAPRRFLKNETGAVILGHGHVLFPGKYLQKPDTEDEDGEQQHRHASQDARP